MNCDMIVCAFRSVCAITAVMDVWRREWDSNPRRYRYLADFRDQFNKPDSDISPKKPLSLRAEDSTHFTVSYFPEDQFESWPVILIKRSLRRR